MRGKTAKRIKKVARLMAVEPVPLPWWKRAAHWLRRAYWWVTGAEMICWFYQPWTKRRLYRDAKKEYIKARRTQ